MPTLNAMTESESDTTDWGPVAAELIQARQTVLPKRLVEPGPDSAQQQAILAAAAAAPDHGRLLPWRFIEIPVPQRPALADLFAQALLERDATATPEQLAQAREKAQRAPWLLLAVVDAERGDDPDVDLHERILSAGCAIQNMLLMATSMGLGSALTSGKALKSQTLRRGFGLGAQEHALCFISFGSVLSQRPGRSRPTVADYLSRFDPPAAP